MREEIASEDVRFESLGVSLAGTYLEPVDAKGSALVLTGSGPLDRNSNGRRFRLEVSSAIAGALAARGVASLRYDKRGAGASGGDYFKADMTDNYADAQAAARWLASRAGDCPPVGIGHSEGALHVANLAADGLVTAGVLIACPARRGEEILTWQAAQILPTLPRTTKAIVKLLRIDPLKSQQKAFAKIRSTSADSIRIQGKKLNARWHREFLDYDPRPILERIQVPVLVVVPGHDVQVPPEDGNAIAGLVAGPCEVARFPDLSHLLRGDPESRGLRGYKKSLQAPADPAVLDTIASWAQNQLP